jgi:feruloyl esterase
MPTMFSILTVMLLSAQAGSTTCEKLAALALPDTTITSAQHVPAGPFTPPAPQGPPGGPVAANPQAAGRGAPAGGRGQGPGAPQATLPAHCRVQAVLKPSSDSHIEMEVWLPAENWNGKFQAVGNGGWAGNISYAALASALQEGYATASNDTGHKGGNALFAIGHPEKLTDFAYRAVHEMTVQSKAIISSYYGRPARLSYWNGRAPPRRAWLLFSKRREL